MLAPQMTTSSKAPAGKSPLVRSLLAVIVVAFLSGCFSAPDGNITDPGTQSSTSATGPPPGYGEFYLPEAAKTGVLRDGECLVGLCLVAGRPVVEDGPAKGLRVALAPDPEVDYMLWRGRSGDINNGILHNRDQAQPDWPIKIETIIYNLEEHWLQGVHLWDRDISLRYLGHDVGNVYYGMMHDFDPVNDDVYGRVVVWNRSSESVTLASDAFFNDTMEVSYPWLLAENQTDPFEPSPHAAYYVYNLETGAERLLWKADEGPYPFLYGDRLFYRVRGTGTWLEEDLASGERTVHELGWSHDGILFGPYIRGVIPRGDGGYDYYAFHRDTRIVLDLDSWLPECVFDPGAYPWATVWCPHEGGKYGQDGRCGFVNVDTKEIRMFGEPELPAWTCQTDGERGLVTFYDNGSYYGEGPHPRVYYIDHL
jgi:hypothetical protein